MYPSYLKELGALVQLALGFPILGCIFSLMVQAQCEQPVCLVALGHLFLFQPRSAPSIT